VKQYAQIGEILLEAAREYKDDVERGVYPAPEHEYKE
jgi:3-methyl-2-oxobutanoate hydroxymethyltransferase